MKFLQLGHDMGGCKPYGGGKRTRERALPKNSEALQKSFWSPQSWILAQEKQTNDTRGGWKTYRTLLARAIHNSIRAHRFARIIRNRNPLFL